jgi:nitroimidazol reductase NimA-like FMN-containing flavoprotein (pyridoxamine 5'-phosphate oxidase superfamily)
MRRTDKEITDRRMIDAIMREAVVCRVAFCDDGIPYIVPMNFGFDKDAIYFHSAPEGRKINIIRKYNKVCFEVDARTELVPGDKPCTWSMRYFSVIGFGEISILTNLQDKRQGLNVIMGKYEGRADYPFTASELKDMVILKLRIESMTGKKSKYASWSDATTVEQSREVPDDHTVRTDRSGRRPGRGSRNRKRN